MSKIVHLLIIIALCTVLVLSAQVHYTAKDNPNGYAVEEISVMTAPPVTFQPSVTIAPAAAEEFLITVERFVAEEPTTKPIEKEDVVSEEDIRLIALVTMAEAEGECEEGKRLVISTILNRVDSEHFPDTVYGVIYQKRHFSSMWNGRVERCEVREDICQLVREELESRTNYDVIFFTAGAYSKYGKPMFKVENHYFSSYD